MLFDIHYDSTLEFEAEDASLLNGVGREIEYIDLGSLGKIESSGLLKTEPFTKGDDSGTCVANFSQYVRYAVADATISITAGNGALMGGTFADNDKILTVNGELVSLEGTLTNAAFDWSTYGTLTGTISLTKGINYIVITAASTATSGYLNVDKIDITWAATTDDNIKSLRRFSTGSGER